MVPMTAQVVMSALRKVTVEPIIFMFMFAALLSAPTIQALVYRKVCLSNYNVHTCDNLNSTEFSSEEDIIQKSTSYWFLVLHLCYEIPAMVTSLIYGNVSDHISRRLAIIIPLLGQVLNVLNYLIMAAVPQIHVGFMVIGPLINGCCGGWIACCLAVYSYISDDSSKSSRTLRIGFAEAVNSIALASGAFISGTLLDHTSYFFVLCIVLIIYIAALFYAAKILKNPNSSTQGPMVHTPTSGCLQKLSMTLHPTSMKNSVAVIFRKRALKRRTHIWAVLAFNLLATLSLSASGTLSFLYLKRQPLSWSQSLIGYFMGTSLMIEGISLMVLMPILKKRLHLKETTILMINLVNSAISEVLFSVSTVTWMVFLVPLLSQIIGSNARAACTRSMVSSFVEPHEYGKMFAIYGAFQSLSGILSSAVYNNLYPLTLSHWAGMCFVIGACFAVFPLILLVWLHRALKHEETYETLREDPDDKSTYPDLAQKYPECNPCEAENIAIGL